MSSRRESVPTARRMILSAAICERALAVAMSTIGTGISVGLTMPIRSEVDAALLANSLRDAGAQVCLPRISGDELVFHAVEIAAELVEGPFGLSEPCLHAPVMDPTLLFVPMLAFDDTGMRLGYGRGYFDRAIARLAAAGPLLTIGLAFDVQHVTSVPSEPHDRRLDAIVTETRVVRRA